MNKECKLAFAYLHEKRAAACLLAAAVAFLFLITELYHAPRELAAVSYTHLDVYKRQQHEYSITCFEMSIQKWDEI